MLVPLSFFSDLSLTLSFLSQTYTTCFDVTSVHLNLDSADERKHAIVYLSGSGLFSLHGGIFNSVACGGDKTITFNVFIRG